MGKGNKENILIIILEIQGCMNEDGVMTHHSSVQTVQTAFPKNFS